MLLRALLIPIVLISSQGLASAPQKKALVRKLQNKTYEIELRYTGKSYGSPCEPSSTPIKFRDSDWIYLQDIDGTFLADQIILTYERGETKFPWSQEALRGQILIKGQVMEINLETPIFNQDSSIDHYEKYHLNGRFKIQFR